VLVDFGRVEPLVSIEWLTSYGNALLAFWQDVTITSDCPTGYFEVKTYDFNAGGTPVASENVSFYFAIE
jgi:hypothetical protein